MDEQMIVEIAHAICCASPCEGCKGHGEGGCFELDLWSREARAAHSVMAGKVAELEAALERCVVVVLEQRCERGTPWDLACTTIAEKVREHVNAALAPHPKGME